MRPSRKTIRAQYSWLGDIYTYYMYIWFSLVWYVDPFGAGHLTSAKVATRKVGAIKANKGTR